MSSSSAFPCLGNCSQKSPWAKRRIQLVLDPFYDRDLENYKRLHADGAISVGIIVTRGKSLQENMRDLVKKVP